jgi:hypothetical protein
MKRLLLIAAIFLIPSVAHATTSCPLGANYGPNQNQTFVALGVSICYYVSASTGSDSNTGGTELLPWAHLPGMLTCTSNCAAFSPVNTIGYGIILEGCDDWGNSNFPVTWTWSGTPSHPIYVDRDPTWYNTTNCPSGWNRAKFDAGGAVIHPPECTNQNVYWNFGSSSNVTVSWVELTGYFWASANSDGSCAGDTYWVGVSTSASNVHWEYSYIHNWTHGGSAHDMNGNAFSTGCATCSVDYAVIDNSDGSQYSGGGQQWPTTHSIFAYATNAIKPHMSGEYAYNNISHMGPWAGSHPNCIETIGTILGSGTFYIHDNWIHDMPNSPTEQCETLQVGNTGETDYVWNNVWCCHIGGGDVAQFPQNNQPNVVGLYFFNNVWEEDQGNGVCANASNSTSWTSAFVMVNNFCLTPNSPNGTTQSQKMMSGSTITSASTIVFSNNINEKISTANANNCNASETFPYAPTSLCQDTVSKGSNLTSTYWPAGFTTNDTTFACSESTVSGVVQAVCPQRTSNTRPIAPTAWDSSAYQYSVTLAALAPSCLPTSGSIPQSPICINPNGGTTVMCETTDGSIPVTNLLGTACAHGSVLTSGGSIFINTPETLKVVAGTSTTFDSSVASYIYTGSGVPGGTLLNGSYSILGTANIAH